MIHVDCGGRLSPEHHRRWSNRRMVTVRGTVVDGPVLTRHFEILHRCDRCDRVGVAVLPAPRGSR